MIYLSFIVILTIGIRLAYIGWMRRDGFYVNDYYQANVDSWGNLAERLAKGKGYIGSGYLPVAKPYPTAPCHWRPEWFHSRRLINPNLYPTAEREPLYPLLLSMVYRLFGIKRYLGLFLQLILDATVAILIFFLGRQLLPSPIPAFLSALIWAVYPPGILMVKRLYSEPLFLLLLTASLLQACNLKESPSRWVWLGFTLGLASLCRSIATYFIPFLLASLYPAWKDKWKLWMRRSLLLLLAWGITVSPWIIRNYRQFDAFILSNTLEGYNLYIYTYPISREGYLHEFVDYYRGEELIFPYTFGGGKPPNEAEVSRQLEKAAWRLILEHPWRFLHLYLYRLGALWFNMGYDYPDWSKASLFIFHGGLLSLSVFGYRRLDPNLRRRALPLAALLLCTVIFSLATRPHVRYLLPTLPGMLILATYGGYRWRR